MTAGTSPSNARSGRATLDLSVLLASIGNRAYTIAVVVYVYQVTHSPSQVAVAASARYLAGLAASAVAFVVVDRVPPRRVLVGANTLCGVLLLVSAAAVAKGSGTGLVIALAALVRAATSLLPPATAALLPGVLGDADLASAAGRQNAIDKMALLAGPAVGAGLLFVVSPALELVAVGLVFLAAAVASTLVPAGSRPAPVALEAPRLPGRRPPGRGGGGGRGAALFGVFSVAAGLLYGVDTVLFVVLANNRFHLGSSGYGLLFAGLGAGGLVAAVGSHRVASRRRLAVPLVVSLCLYCLPTALIAAVHRAGPVLVLEAVRGAGALLLDLLAVNGLQRILLPQRVPFVVSVVTAGVSAAIAAGALVTPLMLDAFGLRGTLLVSGLAVPVLLVPLLPRLLAADAALARRSAELEPRTAVLGRLGLMKGTSRPTLEMLAAGLEEDSVPARTVVVTEGEASDDFYVVVSGEVEVVTGGPAGETVLATLGDDQWFGEIAALTGVPRTATVRTTVPTRLFRIRAGDFREALEQLPPSASLIEGAASRLTLTNAARLRTPVAR